jgi:O-antigen/teichoic acid export membrane protein
MVYLAKGGGWLLFGQIVTTSTAFLVAILFANLLDPQIYGTYRFILSIASILVITTMSGLNISVTQAVSRGFEGSIKTALQEKIKWGLLGSFLGIVLSVYYLINENYQLSIAFLIISIFIPFYESFNIYNSFLVGKKLFRQSTNYESATRVLYLLSVSTTLFLTDNLFIILLSYFIPWTLMRAFFYFKTFRDNKNNDEIDPTVNGTGKRLSVVGGIGSIAMYLDSILLFHYLGPIQVAIYSFALIPVDQISSVFKNITLLSSPKLANRSVNEIKSSINQRLIKLFLLGCLISFGYIVIIPHVFGIVFPQYMEAVLLSQILSLVFIIRLPLSFLTAVIQSKTDVTPASWIHARSLSSVILILCLIILTPLFGVMGVVASRIVSITIAYIVYWTQWIMFLKRSI